MCFTKNAQTACQCISSQFITSKTQETHSRGNTAGRYFPSCFGGNQKPGISTALPGHLKVKITVLWPRYAPAIPGPQGDVVANDWCIKGAILGSNALVSKITLGYFYQAYFNNGPGSKISPLRGHMVYTEIRSLSAWCLKMFMKHCAPNHMLVHKDHLTR